MSDTAATLPVHPAADLLPPMTDEEYDGLKADIAKHGLREKIVKYQGAVLDGRHRYRACVELGVTPEFEDYAGDDPVAYVLSKGLHRRSLTSSQRAMIAVEAEKMLAAAAKERQRAGGRTKGQGSQKVDQPADPNDGKAAEQAAKLTNTNRQYVADAKKLTEAAPDLAAEVRAGQMGITAAKKEMKRRQPATETPPATNATVTVDLDRQQLQVDDAAEPAAAVGDTPTAKDKDNQLPEWPHLPVVTSRGSGLTYHPGWEEVRGENKDWFDRNEKAFFALGVDGVLDVLYQAVATDQVLRDVMHKIWRLCGGRPTKKGNREAWELYDWCDDMTSAIRTHIHDVLMVRLGDVILEEMERGRPKNRRASRHGKGVTAGNEAINCLLRISGPEELARAFQIVTNFIEANPVDETPAAA
jgi:hypothetical protein